MCVGGDVRAGLAGEPLRVERDLRSTGIGHGYNIRTPGGDTGEVDRQVRLLTREGCPMCATAAGRLDELAAELGFSWTSIDVDAAAAAGDAALRAEYGDRLPVVLLDGVEHSYWEVDEQRLRADLAR
ncbi:glutaredoxin-like domain (DUF836) [Mycobacterium sp. PO1]|nr:glutaredoxin-like domain (DUF836) [Mycobacterium sp. PO1]GFM22025.1 glutaredoxin-like domain (DUF836) [Mycobacterium sp. PO2]